MKYQPPLNGDEANPNRPYVDANVAAGIEGSIPPGGAMEHPQREILAAIEAAGLVPDAGNLAQLVLAIRKLSAFPKGYLSGFNVAIDPGDPVNDLTVQPFVCRSDDDEADIRVAAALTCALDASEDGGLDDGLKAANTWYYLWVIAQGDGANPALLFSADQAAPTLPDGFTRKRLLWAIRTDGGSAIVPFTQYGSFCEWQTPPLDYNVSAFTTGARTLFSVTVPPGRPRKVKIRSMFNDGGGGGQMILLTSPGQADLAPSINATPLNDGYDNANGITFNNSRHFTDSQSRLGLRSDKLSGEFRLVTIGFEFDV